MHIARHLTRNAQLVVELRQPRVTHGDVRGQELERNRLIECQIVGSIHLPHAATAR